MFFVTSVLRFFARGGLASLVRAGVQAVARAFQRPPTAQKQPEDSSCTPKSTPQAPAPEPACEKTLATMDEGVTITHASKTEREDDAPVVPAAVGDNSAGASEEETAEETRATGKKALVTHPAEATAIYAFARLLDVANFRLDHVVRQKTLLETEADELRRRVQQADAVRAEETARLEKQLGESRAREYALRIQLRRQADFEARCEAELRRKVSATRLAHELLVQTTRATNAKLRDEKLTLELRVADLEAELAEATADPRAEVEFLLERLGELELALEAAYARLGVEPASGNELLVPDSCAEAVLETAGAAAHATRSTANRVTSRPLPMASVGAAVSIGPTQQQSPTAKDKASGMASQCTRRVKHDRSKKPTTTTTTTGGDEKPRWK